MATRDWTVSNSSRVIEKSKFTDLDLTFTSHPITGDITTKKDTDAIKRAVKNIVLTNHYERPFKPNFGSNLRGLLFELGTPTAYVRIKEAIADELNILEPRINVDHIQLNQMDNEVMISLFYSIKGDVGQQSVDFTVRRVR